MADAAVDLGATDHFALGVNFHEQSSSSEPFSTEEVALASDGDVACTNTHDSGTNYSATYKYCGTDLADDLAATGTAFGTVVNSILPTTIDFDFSVGAQPELTLNGHNHDNNAHDSGTNSPNLFNFSAVLPAAIGTGVPNFVTVAGETSGAASRNSASLSIAVNHIDKEGNSGHHVGESITCRVDLSVDYEGVSGSPTAGNWLQILTASNDANEDTDTSSLTAHQYIDAT
jgi:hypothetical protein